MTDDRRLQIELYLDDELPAADRLAVERFLAVDVEASSYLAQLRRLRSLAVRHDPTPSPLPKPKSASAPIGSAIHWAATFVVAASLALVALNVGFHRPNPAVELVHVPAPVAEMKIKSDVDWYLWANADDRSAAVAAKASLAPLPKHGSRNARREILVIEMANSETPAVRAPRNKAARRTESMRRG